MDKKVKKEWIAALRSGEYKRCRNVLHDGEGFCCLGVLLDIAYDGDWVSIPNGCGTPRWRLGNEELLPSGSFLRRVGISDDNARQLAHMNDGTDTLSGKGRSFRQIANWIEKNL